MNEIQADAAALVAPRRTPTLRGHIKIARFDHWVKNVFVFPGIVVALGIDRAQPIDAFHLVKNTLIGLLAVGFIASSNYVINEVLDAPFDRLHAIKCARPVPSGQVSVKWAYVQWLLMMVVGLGMGLLISVPFTLTLVWLWIMGCIYNIPPVRSKDLPYIDVLSEAINNPIRMLAGWFIVGTHSIAPASLLLSYWMVGCYFMAIKRYAEYRDIGDPARAASYRRSFAYYTLDRLLVSIVFYGSTAMLFLGAFIMRYRLELILAFPFVAWVMAIYLSMAFKPESAAQNPESLYREKGLMLAVGLCTCIISVCLLVNMPILQTIFAPTAPTIAAAH